MAESSNNNRSGGRSRNRNRNRNRNSRNGQNSGGNSNRDGNSNRGGGGGDRKGKGRQNSGDRKRSGGRSNSNRGGGSREFIKMKVPRRTRPLTLWEKFLNLFGLGPVQRKPPASSRPPREGNAAASPRAAEGEASKPKPKAKSPRKKAPKERERAPRKLEKVVVSGTRLHVGNLSYDTADSDLDALFAKIGPVASSEVVTHGKSGRSKGFAFVEMENVDDAKRAAEELHDQDFMGRKITVGGAKSNRPSDAR